MVCVEPIRERYEIELVKNILKKQSERDYIMFLLGINSGLRISDILQLKVNDVKNKKFIELFEKKTKKYKRFPISGNLKTELDNFTKEKKGESWLFSSNRTNNPITRIQAYRIIRKACKDAGIELNIGTHTLRKTFGYHFYLKTKDIALLQTILNHSSPKITLKYICINQDLIDSSLKAFAL